MAITAAQLNTALGTQTYGTAPVVVEEMPPYQTASGAPASQFWLVRGGVLYPGKSMIVKTTASDDAATQASTITTAFTGAGNANT